MSYLGVDLHTNSFTVCRRTVQGKETVMTFSLSRVDKFVKTLRNRDQLAVEATGNTAWFVEQVNGRLKRVVVVDPNKFKVILQSVKKTDKNDAKTLAYFLSKDMLPEARMKSKENAQLHSLAATRDNLVSIKGIGSRSATILLSVIGDINDFATAGKLASYFGIVPKVRDSNETVRHGRITKHGSKLARTTLVQCTLAAKRFSPYLRRYYERVKSNRGSGKAIIATARKLLNIIFDTLKDDLIFEDFPNFVIASSCVKK